MQQNPFPGEPDFRPHFTVGVSLLISAGLLLVGVVALIVAYVRKRR